MSLYCTGALYTFSDTASTKSVVGCDELYMPAKEEDAEEGASTLLLLLFIFLLLLLFIFLLFLLIAFAFAFAFEIGGEVQARPRLESAPGFKSST